MKEALIDRAKQIVADTEGQFDLHIQLPKAIHLLREFVEAYTPVDDIRARLAVGYCDTMSVSEQYGNAVADCRRLLKAFDKLVGVRD